MPGIPILLLAVQIAGGARDAEPAHRLWLKALERYDRYDVEGALDGLRAAQSRDPSYLPAHISWLTLMQHEGRGGEAAREYAARTERGPVYACIAAAASREAIRVERLLAVENEYGPGPCTSYYLAQFVRLREPAAIWQPRAIAAAQRAVEALPELGTAWIELALALRTAGNVATAEGAVRTGLEVVPDPGQRVRLHELHASLREAVGDSVAARAIRRALGAALVRDGPPRPGLRHLYQLSQAALYSPHVFEVMRREVEIASAIGAPDREWSARFRMALALVDQGRPAEAVPEYRRLARITEQLDNDTLRMKLHLRRGRAYAKLGETATAARDLDQAILLARRLDDRMLLSDAYHNLAHVHESAGALAEAARAIEQTVAIAHADLDSLPIHIIALRDAGVIHGKAGREAAAHDAFRAMVAVIERQQRHYVWAGEYLERIGDWRAAVRYYRRGLTSDPRERGLNLAGLARSYARLGLPDSAAAAAREHDAVLIAPDAVPLLPVLLAAEERWPEAIAEAEAWVRRREEGGHLEGIAAAWLQLADLRQRAGAAGAALRAADAALRRAREARVPALESQALLIAGRAHLDLGRHRGGVERLRNAAARALEHPTHDAVLRTHLELGRALASSEARAALAALDRAALEVERSTELLALDFDRVRYRHTHLEPFDLAIGVILDEGTRTGAVSQLAEWSQRRSAAALAIAARSELTGVGGPASSAGPVPLAELQRALAPGDAVVDYFLLPEAAAALVLRRHTAAVVRLAVTAEELQRLAHRLASTFASVSGGRLDLARAPFDTSAARLLHASLIEPLQPMLAGARRLAIVPDGVLHRVPFDALVARLGGREAPGGTAFLVDAYETVHLPSLGFVPAAFGSTSLEPRPLLAVGTDAPGTMAELDAIRDAWRAGPVLSLVGAAATESAVDSIAGGYAALHIAAHARAAEDRRMGAYLDLLPDAANDGAWHVMEIAAARRDFPLVVLSACETLEGDLYRGEGPFGLARAFLATGARAVIATHWPVGEGTASLMREFYHELQLRADPGAALRTAKLRLLRDPATAHPFHWAAFVLVAGSTPAAVRSRAPAQERVPVTSSPRSSH